MTFKKLLNLILLIIITLSTITPSFANNLESADYENKQNSTLKSIDISNFSKLDNNFYRSGQPKGEDYKALSELGIKTIINLRLAHSKQIKIEKKIAESYGIKFVNIPLNPFLHPNSKQIQIYYDILKNPDNLPVLVHCRYGQDRTGVMTALYRVKYYNWNYNKAYDEMIAFGYHKTLYSRQKHFLWEYIKEQNPIKPMN